LCNHFWNIISGKTGGMVVGRREEEKDGPNYL
jgi:hypothetical protein